MAAAQESCPDSWDRWVGIGGWVSPMGPVYEMNPVNDARKYE